MEFLIEALLELVLQLVLELVVALGDGLLGISPRITRRFFKAILYIACSVIVAVVSLSLFPTPLLSAQPNPWISLLIVPLSVGIFIVHFSRWIGKTRNWDIELEKFSFSLLFAFCFALTRYLGMSVGS